MSRRRNSRNNSNPSTRAGNKSALALGIEAHLYTLDPQVVKDVASFSYHTPLGTRLSYDVIAVSSSPGANPEYYKAISEYFPGIMSFGLMPAVGETSPLEATPINIAAKNLYAYVRHANSGSRNYEAVDLTLYMLAMDSLYTVYSWCQKLYSIALTAKAENRYYPIAYLVAEGLSQSAAADLLGTLADFRTFLNVTAQRLRAFCIPKTMSYFLRHSILVSNIWKDAEIKKSNNYTFHPEVVYQYDDTNGRLTPTSLTFGSVTTSTIKTLMNQLLNALITSEDIGIMSGDILKAFGEDGLYNVVDTPEDYHVEETYNPEMLQQIQGMYIPGNSWITDPHSLYIGQDGEGHVVMGIQAGSKPEIVASSAPAQSNFASISDGSGGNYYLFPDLQKLILNAYKDDMTPEENMVATRLMVSIKIGQYQAWGSELILSARIVQFSTAPTATDNYDVLSFYTYNIEENFLGSIETAYLRFDWAPKVFVTDTASTGDNATFNVSDFLETQNVAVISADNLRNCHEVALLSEFGAPLLGTRPRSTT